MKSSHRISLGIFVLIALWLLSGVLFKSHKNMEATKDGEGVVQVKVMDSKAQEHLLSILARGFTEADRIVDIKAEIEGRIEEVLVQEGALVEEGTPLFRIDMREKKSLLRQAQALLAQRKLELDAAKTLFEKQFQSKTNLALAQARYDEAKALVDSVERNIGETLIKAPFKGILESRDVEVGTFVKVGDSLCKVVSLNPLVAVLNISEIDIGHIKEGQQVNMHLTAGGDLKGIVSYVSKVADPNTRSFKVKVDIENPEMRIPDGLSLEADFSTEKASAHFISPAILTLNTQGQMGLKILDSQNKVQFMPVKIVDSQTDGVWVSGLPPQAKVIVVGQEFVNAGQIVKPVDVKK